MGPWDSSREAPATSASWRLLFGWEHPSLAQSLSILVLPGVLWSGIFGFSPWVVEGISLSWGVAVELGGVVPACLGENSHPADIREVLVISRPPLPLQGIRNALGVEQRVRHMLDLPPPTVPSLQ